MELLRAVAVVLVLSVFCCSTSERSGDEVPNDSIQAHVMRLEKAMKWVKEAIQNMLKHDQHVDENIERISKDQQKMAESEKKMAESEKKLAAKMDNFAAEQQRIAENQKKMSNSIENIDRRVKRLEHPATTARPTTTRPTTTRPTTARPTTVCPTTARPTTVRPTTVRPTTARPTTVRPTTVGPTTVRPTTARPTTVRPTTVRPTTHHLFHWVFQGNEFWGAHDDYDYIGRGISLEECKRSCEKKHEVDQRWNGLEWGSYYNDCFCAKGDRGHGRKRSDWHHYWLE